MSQTTVKPVKPVKPIVDLNFPYFSLVARLRLGRALWLTGALLALGLEMFSVLYFQQSLGLRPCLYCVYIRQGALLIAIGAFWAAILPQWVIFRLPGHLLSLAGSLVVIIYAFELEVLNARALHWPQAYAPCGARPGLALGRWLARKWPGHFSPQGDCGVDSNWSFGSFNMAELLLVSFILVFCALVVGLGAGIYQRSLTGQWPFEASAR
ncbi:MAG: disulfide bond formation protein B [Deltaproteobacteria bacterium]|jgi:disulfide bond formation protein DsbB|nr:disulfide bond formation protein B [Deltaproteobacteria bacterium]